jgi:hypothetical protein
MISAAEALKRSEDINSEKNSKQIKEIELKIEKAINEGKRECFVYNHLNEPVAAEMKRLGYKIENSSHYNEVTIRIHW